MAESCGGVLGEGQLVISRPAKGLVERCMLKYLYDYRADISFDVYLQKTFILKAKGPKGHLHCITKPSGYVDACL